MRFENTFYIYFLIFVPLIFLLLVIAQSKSKKQTQNFISKLFYESLFKGASRGRNFLKITLFCMSLSFMFLALARPQFGKTVEQIYTSGVNIAVVFDVSNSMLAEDLKPSRIVKAKNSVEKFVDMLAGDRVALIVFAGSSILVSPLSTDYGAFKMYLNSVDTNFLSSHGTALGRGIQQGVEAIKRSTQGEGTNVILLVTDGEDHEGEINKAIESAKDINAKIYILGAATESGAPVPELDKFGNKSSYKKDNNGEIVVSRLDIQLLSKLATETGGKIHLVSYYDSELVNIIEDIHGMESKKIKEKKLVKYKDRYRWALLPAFILMFIGVLL